MTTKPRARKFRIKRASDGAGSAAEAVAPDDETEDDAPDAAPAAPSMADVAKRRAAALAALKDGSLDRTAPAEGPGTPRPAAPVPASSGGTPTASAPAPASAARDGEVSSAAEARSDTDIDSIRQEGLTGRQLRMARRVAQKYGLAPTSDFDAVRQLRAQGIDPFKPTNMLELVVPAAGQGGGGEVPPGGAAPAGQPQLPARRPQSLPKTIPLDGANLPSTEVNPADRRAREIIEIQRDIARRRRKRLALLFTRLAFFVFAPTLLAAYYYYVVATPMYASKAEFLILQADNAGGSGIGGLLQGTQFATNQDAIAVQSYLQSKDAMVRLDEDMGFKAHFEQDWIDPIQRLGRDPSNEEAYSLYKKYVKISYDPSEGVIRMEVSAADPEVSARFASHLIGYAEERVDELSRRKREDGMATARESLEKAKAERRAAQEELVRLQEGTFIDPEGYIGSLRTQIANYETQLQEKQLQLQALLDNRRPNEAKVDGARGDVRRLQALLAELNGKMTDATTGETSLAEKAARIQMAQADLATADLFLQSALQNEKQTELEANRQVRYLTTSVNPVAAEDPTYPRKFENTILAFLILSGIYLMISLTASILREQVSH
jgi:capsular polysaccharide transport system permease protein